MRNLWFVALPVLVAALWALMLWTPEHAPIPDAASEEPDFAPVAMEPKPRAPEVPVVEPAAPPAAAPTQAPEPPTTTPPVALPRMPPPTVTGPVNDLRHRYESESAPGAPPPQQQQLAAAFDGDVADLLDHVECRRTICRARLTWLPKHGFSGMQLLAELRRDFDPNLAIDAPGPSSATGAQTVDVFIDMTSSRPKVP